MVGASPATLEPAPDGAFRGSGSAWLVDDRVVRLSQLEARTRYELGQAAARFLAIGGHGRLGFSRVGDYARERLGISGRELQSFVFVASRLGRLPLLARAFARGEISWSQVRLLCAIADGDSEAFWLERARGLTVREIVLEIRRGREGSITAGDLGDALDEESDCSDGEPRVRFSIACPARVALLWRRAVEVARRMLGSQAPVWQAAEAIVAEASSALAIDPGSAVVAVREEAQRSPRLARPPIDDEEPWVDPELESLDAFGLDRELRELVHVLHVIDVDLGVALRRVVDLSAHRALGFSTFDSYVRERLGISPAKARALVMVERRLREAPALADTYRSGALSWVRALAILPVIDDPSRAAAWVARAREVMVRGLQDEVEWALDMRDAHGRPPTPPEPGTVLEHPDLQICARVEGDAASEVADRRVTFFGPASVVALFQAGVSALTSPDGTWEPRWAGFERLLLHAIAEWEAQPRHRDPIFARGGWRCAVPGCSGRRSLHDHHIEFRSRGGGNEQWNRAPICAAHHLHGLHRNVIVAHGRAPDDVVWELGLRPGRAPLLRLAGERYLNAL